MATRSVPRPRQGTSADPSFGGRARRGSTTPPKWAAGLTPDQIEAEREARRLPTTTDPDTIDDPDVRSRFLARLQKVDAGTADELHQPSRRPATATGGRRGSTRPGSRSSRPGRRVTPTLRPPSRLSASDGTGFALGLVLYALAINYLRGGPAGVKQWLRAKFLNDDGSRSAGSSGGGPVPNYPPGTPHLTPSPPTGPSTTPRVPIPAPAPIPAPSPHP